MRSIHAIKSPPAEPILLADAARMLGWSLSWTKRRLRRGYLEATTLDGQVAITADSINNILPFVRRRQSRPKLHLVVDNT